MIALNPAVVLVSINLTTSSSTLDMVIPIIAWNEYVFHVLVVVGETLPLFFLLLSKCDTHATLEGPTV